MSTATPSSPSEPPELRVADERLATAQAFRRFVERVSLRAGRWLTHWGVSHVDRDDVFQDALLRMYQQRELYDPALGCWESWAFSYVGGVVDRVMSADMAAGKLGDDGTEVERYMGSPNATPRAGLGARILRTLGPRALFALTHVAAATVGAGVVYALMRHDPSQNDTTANARAAASSLVAHVGLPRDPAPTETAAPSTGVSELPELPELPELRAVELSADAGAGPSAAGRDAVAGEQSLFDRGSTAFQTVSYEDAIKVLEEHANKYPRGPYSAARERLLTLALIRAGRKPEARQRIERLRQASPGSAFLAEFDAAMTTKSP